MTQRIDELLKIDVRPKLQRSTMVLAFSGWMDGGDVSTGTVNRLIKILEAPPIAEIDPEPFYIYNFPGSMEIAALFRPHVSIEDGLIKSFEMPTNAFYCHEPSNLVLFTGKEPNLRWRTFGDCVFEMARRLQVQRILFVGSFGGSVPHTREPRLYVACSDPALLPQMEAYGLRRTGYEGPGSFVTYLMPRAHDAGLDLISLVAEIPSYLNGANPTCIEAVTRRLAKILRLPLDLASLRARSTEWELQVSNVVEQDEDMARTVRQLEEEYDNELLRMDREPD
jgi:proteasome assembly chaperone (PAC2) family protein